MKTFARRAAITLALILLTLVASIIVAIPRPSAADNAADGIVVWKQVCPWRAQIDIRQDGNDLVVQCLQSR